MMKIYLTVLSLLVMILLTLSHPVRRDARLECGAFGINLDPVLNATDYEEIIPCCYDHDTCYRTCGATHEQCDCQFYKCINQRCISRAADGVDCFWLAIGGYGLVHKGGALPYAQGQSTSGCAATASQSSSEEDHLDNPHNCPS